MFDQAAVLHVGTPSPEFTAWASSERMTKMIFVHGFGNLSTERGAEFEGLGNQWFLKIFPDGDATAAEGMTSLYLYSMSDKAIGIDFGFSIIDGDGNQVVHTTPHRFERFDPTSWGWSDFAKRSELISSLVDGTLAIEVRMELPVTASTPPFIPENPSNKIIQGLFMKDDSADIVFVLGWNSSRINETVDFPAHGFVIRKCSSVLSELCGSEEGGGKTTTIEISNVSPHIFYHMLSHMYGHNIFPMGVDAREILDAANRYGIIDLKLEAEAYLVKSTVFSIDNLLDLLLYADSQNCALLKEAAMDFMLENRGEVLKKVLFHDAPGSLLSDFLAAMARKDEEGGVAGESREDKLMTMRISDLRKKAHEMKLDVDGSREMLIATLKEAEAYLDVSSNDNSDEESDYEFIEDADEDSEDD